MEILTVSGSARPESSNNRLLAALPSFYPGAQFRPFGSLDKLPVFTAGRDRAPWDEEVLKWRQAVSGADALVISTPEYIYNLPALIKNALEWLTSSGEMMHKPVLPITFTPNEPRGEKAMQSLLWSLQALDARIVAQLPLYQNELVIDEKGQLVWNDAAEMLAAALDLLS